MEQSAIYQQIQVDWNASNPTGAQWWRNGANVRVARTRIPTYMCPSDSLEDVFLNPNAHIALGVYTESTYYTIYSLVSDVGGDGIGLTNYFGMNGVKGLGFVNSGGVAAPITGRGLRLDKYKPPFASSVQLFGSDKVVYSATLDAITASDGTSNTLFFGESLNSDYGQPRDYGFTWMGGAMNPAYWVIPSAAGDLFWGDWSSNHAGVVNFAFGDGSVRTLRQTGRDAVNGIPNNPLTTPERAFWALSGYGDGDSTPTDSILNY